MTTDSTYYILSRCTGEYFYEFSPSKNSFITNDPRPPLSRCAFTKYKKFIYGVGGYRDEALWDRGLIYDIDTKIWTDFSCPIRRAFCELCTIGDQMYLFGGLNTDGDPENSCFCYSYTNDRWVTLPNMKNFRGSPAVAFYDSSLFIMGGFTNGCNCQVERYDPREGTWSTAGYISIFGMLSSVVIGDSIHILNSYSGKYCKYDPRMLSCTEETKIPFFGKTWLGNIGHQLHVIHADGIDAYHEVNGKHTNILEYNFEKCPCMTY